MQEDEDYELVPAKRVQILQEQLDELKRNPLGTMPAGTDMISSMNKLSRTMDEMLSLFKDAASQMQTDERESPVANKRQHEVLMEKLDTLIDQNYKIAKGILAVADMLKEMRHQRPSFMPSPRISIMPNPPSMPRQEDVFGPLPQSNMGYPPPNQSMSSMMSPSGFPPPGMTGGPPRTLPQAPSPPSFMAKKREAVF